MPGPVAGGGGTVAATGSAPRPTGKTPNPAPKVDKANDAPPEGRFKRALGQAREGGKATGADNGDGQRKPAPKRPPSSGGGMGRAQPSGSKPQQKKRRK